MQLIPCCHAADLTACLPPIDAPPTQLFIFPPSSPAAFYLVLVASIVPLVDTLCVMCMALHDQLEKRAPACDKALLAPLTTRANSLMVCASDAADSVLAPMVAPIDHAVKGAIDASLHGKALLLGQSARVTTEGHLAPNGRGSMAEDERAAFVYVSAASGSGGTAHCFEVLLRSGCKAWGRAVQYAFDRFRQPFLIYGEMVRGSPLKCAMRRAVHVL